MSFAAQIKQAIDSGDIKEMLKVSVAIHEFEENGGEISNSDDRLWMKLTEKIIKKQLNQNSE